MKTGSSEIFSWSPIFFTQEKAMCKKVRCTMQRKLS